MLNYKSILEIKKKLRVGIVAGLAAIAFGCDSSIDINVDKDSKIAFCSDKNGNYDIYTMNHDGSNLEQITNTPWNEYSPSWLPDGKQIVYQSDEGSNQDTGEYYMNILKINLDGTNKIQLTNFNEGGSMPDVDFNGNEIVFVSNRSGVSEVYTMHIDGGNQTQITHSDNSVGNWQPEFSPDGNEIVYSQMELYTPNMFLYVLNLNDSSNRKIETDAINNQTPSWSPDGNYMAFSSNLYNNDSFNIGVIDLSTGEVNELTDNGKSYNPSWSPDGKWIVYQFFNVDSGQTSIRKVNMDTKEEIILIENTEYSSAAPSWSPYLE